MIVNCDNIDYTLSNENINNLFDRIEQFTLSLYAKIPDAGKIAGQAMTRGFLALAEKNEKDKEKRLKYRPPRRSDPTVHLLHLLIEYVKDALPNVTTQISTAEYEITAISFQIKSESRRYLSADRDTGKWEDNSRKDDR